MSVEIIPAGFGAGYGGGVLAHDKNLAAGLPVHGALFVAGQHEAHFVPDSPAKLLHGNFERIHGELPASSCRGARFTLETG